VAFYRFARASRQVIVNFLGVYLAEEQKHWDGTDWIELPAIHVVDAREYDERTLPSVVTDSAAGTMRTLSFSNIIGQWHDTEGIYGPKDNDYRVYGGRGDFDITVTCSANDRELQQKLTDVATVYLAVGRGWVFYNRHVLMRDIRILGDGVDDSTPQEPVYYANLIVPTTADWRILVSGETLERLDFDIELVTPDDPFEDLRELPPGVYTPLDKSPLVAVFDPGDFPPNPAQPKPSAEESLRPMKTPYGRLKPE